MTDESGARRAQLLGKERLTVAEMIALIAEMVAEVPTVRSVAVAGEDAEIAVGLNSGKHFAIAAIPIAGRMNESMASRRQALDDLIRQCA